jgi:protein-S-isoprenylcysteine O-methyltransferase Ste14
MTRDSSRWNEFRARGGLWVAAQFVLIAGIVLAFFLPPHWPESVRRPLAVPGILVTLTGVALAVWAYRSLGRSFTAYPSPPEDAALVESGPYRLVRHPVYGGAILLFAGLSLAFSISALLLTAALAALWRAKAAVEEKNLASRFPGYEAYRARTTRRFFPGLY